MKYRICVLITIVSILTTFQTSQASLPAFSEMAISIPIALSNSTTISAINLDIAFDPSQIEVMGLTFHETILENSQYAVHYNTDTPGVAKIVMFATQDSVYGSGIVLFVNILVKGNPFSDTTIKINQFVCNTTPDSGGFGIENDVVESLQLKIYHPCDADIDGIISLKDAIYFFQMASDKQLDLNNKDQTALPRVIQTLQEISAIDATKQSSQATILKRKKSLSSGTITASSCDTVIVPIVIEDFVMMEGLIVSVGFDSTWIDINASLADSVLSSQNYIMSQNMLENKFNCWIYAISNPVSNSGTVAFLHIDIQGYNGQTTQLNLNGLYCNSVPVRGGFMLNDRIYQHIEITIENNQFYNIETNVAYNGSLTGVLHALATQMDDTSIIMAQNHVRWPNDQPVKLEVKNGTYQLTGFLDTNDNQSPDPWEPYGNITHESVAICNEDDISPHEIMIPDILSTFQAVSPIPAQLAGPYSQHYQFRLDYLSMGLTSGHCLNLSIYYDSRIFTSFSIESFNYSASYHDIINDTLNGDHDIETDKVLNIQWTNSLPSESKMLSLCMLHFIASSTVEYESTYTIHIQSSDVYQKDVTYTAKPFYMDIDGNGKVTALTDGLMLIRGLSFLESNENYDLSAVTDNINGTRQDIEWIIQYIQAGISNLYLDFDCNGEVNALQDGLLMLRYLFQIDQGSSFLDGAVDPDGECVDEKLIVERILQVL